MKTSLIIRLKLATIIRNFRLSKYRLKGYNLSSNVIVENGVLLDKIYPGNIIVKENTLIARNVVILSHDHHKRDKNGNPKAYTTIIGKNCLIGIGAIILPGVEIGDEVIVAAGSVVTKSFPSNTIIAGNPAKIIKENIKMNSNCELL